MSTVPTGAQIATKMSALSRRFRDVRAVDDLSLHVPRRSVYGFLGPTGAGETTTIRLLLSLMRADRGNVRVLEQTITRVNRWTLLRGGR